MLALTDRNLPLPITRRGMGLGLAAALLAPRSAVADAVFDTPERYGAVGDGRADDMAAWKRALASGRPVRGAPRKVYGLRGDLDLPEVARIEQARFRQLAPNAPNRRTLKANGSARIVLDRVVVDRGDNPDSGSLGNSCGIFLGHVGDFSLRNCEVTGDGRGTGLSIAFCDKGEIVGGLIHDMVAGSPAEPTPRDGDDQLIGVWIVRSSNIRVQGMKVANLLSQWAGQRPTAINTRGFCLGQTEGGVRFSNCVVANVEEGFDFSGTQPIGGWSASDCRAENCRLFGFKTAASSDGVYERCVAYRCGLTGYIVDHRRGSDCRSTARSITYSDCTAIETGFGRPLGPRQPTFGFRVDTNGDACRRGITWVRCKALGGRDMTIGFANAEPTRGRDGGNRAIDCEARGALMAGFKGVDDERSGGRGPRG